MPFNIEYPLVNGHRYSFASVEAQFNGLPILGIKSINYSPELMPGKVYGSAPQKIGRTRGKEDSSADFEMLRLEFENLKETLGNQGVGFGETAFDIVVQFAEIPNSPVVTDTLIGFRITKPDLSNADGTDPSMVKVTGDPMRILLGGVPIATPVAPIGI